MSQARLKTACSFEYVCIYKRNGPKSLTARTKKDKALWVIPKNQILLCDLFVSKESKKEKKARLDCRIPHSTCSITKKLKKKKERIPNGGVVSYLVVLHNEKRQACFTNKLE